MHILLVGNGGREHALLWKLRRDAPDARFTVTRPNGGMRGVDGLDVAPADVDALAAWAERERPDLTVVGPEAPLAAGLVDALQQRGLAAFGPTRAAAEIESSKAFAKRLMQEHGVATARYRVFQELEPAEVYIRQQGAPVVVKASGLAAGKGAVVCDSVEEALDAARGMLAGGEMGAAGEQIVVEQFMRGEELSVFALCDGERALPMIAARDHKRVGEGDTGPNTGGMGAYAPLPDADEHLLARVNTEILSPVLRALAAEGRPFRGLLYAGLMHTEEGLRVVEFNCRFGDPETQALLPLLQSSLLDPMLAIARGESLAGHALVWRGDTAAVTTVVASPGYPGSYPKGLPLQLDPALDTADDLLVFHAGTARTSEGTLVTAGGRVLAVTALGDTLDAAAERSRWGAQRARFEGAFFRGDIARLRREL